MQLGPGVFSILDLYVHYADGHESAVYPPPEEVMQPSKGLKYRETYRPGKATD
jgi:hypothetical protein